MENGDPGELLQLPGGYGFFVLDLTLRGFGNGEWRRWSATAAHAAGDAGNCTLYCGSVSMDNGEWRTELENMRSAPSPRV